MLILRYQRRRQSGYNIIFIWGKARRRGEERRLCQVDPLMKANPLLCEERGLCAGHDLSSCPGLPQLVRYRGSWAAYILRKEDYLSFLRRGRMQMPPRHEICIRAKSTRIGLPVACAQTMFLCAFQHTDLMDLWCGNRIIFVQEHLRMHISLIFKIYYYTLRLWFNYLLSSVWISGHTKPIK